MPYADSDFFLAILKSDDWLKEKALVIHEKNKGNIWTSGWTIVEMLLIAERFEIDPERLVVDMFEIANVKDANKEQMMAVSHMMKKYRMKTFDALHAISCGKDKIISSDSVFDTIGLDRIPLEKDL